MVRQQFCDFIEAEENFENLKVFIQPHTSGKNYIQKSGMQGSVWASKVELMATALKCGKDVICYYSNNWSHYPASGNIRVPTVNDFFLDNSSGAHYHAMVAP